MSRNKNIDSLIIGLGRGTRLLRAEEVCVNGNKYCLEITVDHRSRLRTCIECDSDSVIWYGNKCEPSWAWHIPQGTRRSTKIVYHKHRMKCKCCGRTFFEDIPWIYNYSHLTSPLAEAIKNDLCTLMTKKDIARVNCVPIHYVDNMVKLLTPSVPDHLPTVICLDETFAQVEEFLNEKTKWLRFITNFSDGETGELLDILPFRSKGPLIRYFLDNFTYEERCKVKHICCDGAASYRNIQEICFPNADVCLDNYHVFIHIHKGFNMVFTKRLNEILSKSKNDKDKYRKQHNSLKGSHHRFITSIYNQRRYWNDKYDEYSSSIIHHISEYPELKDAYAMIQYFREIFHDIHNFEDKVKELDLWLSIFEKSTSDGINYAVNYLKRNLKYIHTAWKHGYSNAICEGNNNVIQTLKDLSFGLHDFKYFRTRALLIVGHPGVSHKLKEHYEEDNSENQNKYNSLFFTEFPSLEDYVLAYDHRNPTKDFSKEV